MGQDSGDWKSTHRFKDWDYLVRRTIMIACGVDISPPLSEDEDRAMDPMEEVKHQFLPWLLDRWEFGVRAPTSKHYFRAKDMAQQVYENTDEDGWLNALSKRRTHPIEQKMGRCLGQVSGVPFEVEGKVYVLKRGARDGVSGYWFEVLK